MQNLSANTNTSLFNQEYLSALSALRRRLKLSRSRDDDDRDDGDDDGPTRVWSSAAAWRRRVQLAFTDEVAHSLMSLQERGRLDARRVMHHVMMDEAKSYEREYYIARADNLPLNAIEMYKLQLLQLQSEAIDIFKRKSGKLLNTTRATAVTTVY
jgi:hypothetical protein